MTLEGKTPMEVWSKKHANDYDSLHIFGCPAYYHVRNERDRIPQRKHNLKKKFQILNHVKHTTLIKRGLDIP